MRVGVFGVKGEEVGVELDGVGDFLFGFGFAGLGEFGVAFIDGAIVNGSARAVGSLASVVRLVQTGYLYWYALVMILGLMGLMTWQLWPYLGSLIGR